MIRWKNRSIFEKFEFHASVIKYHRRGTLNSYTLSNIPFPSLLYPYFPLDPWIQVDQNCIGPRSLSLSLGIGNRIQSQITTVHRSSATRFNEINEHASLSTCLQEAFPAPLLVFFFFSLRARSAEFRFKLEPGTERGIIPLLFSFACPRCLSNTTSHPSQGHALSLSLSQALIRR